MSLTALSTQAFTPPPSPGALQTVTASGWPRGFSVWLWGGSPGESRPCPSVESAQEGRGRGWGWGGGECHACEREHSPARLCGAVFPSS